MTQAWILGVVSILCSGAALAQTTYHVGVGAGPEYGGLGATIERVTDNDKVTFGGGLVNSHRIVGEAYGASLMYHRFDLINAESGEHALGIGIAPVGHRWRYFVEQDTAGRWHYRTDYHDVIYGGLLAYNYHPRGASLGGFHIGVSYGYGSRAGETASGLNITFGYRFN